MSFFVSALAATFTFLNLSSPVQIMPDAQTWEGDQQAHTLSVVEMNRDGFKYWGYYGLNAGRGMGVAFSNDLIHWTKHSGNPLSLNARWPSAIKGADPHAPNKTYIAITRDYDSKQSHIVLAATEDGINIKDINVIVAKREFPENRNQNPNLFRDPASKDFVLTFYRGSDKKNFQIVMKRAKHIEDLGAAKETVLLKDTAILAAPSLMLINGTYFLSTEVFAGTYPDGKWAVKMYSSKNLTGPYRHVPGATTLTNDQACLFQHEFQGKYYGFLSRLVKPGDKWIMEMVQADLK